MITKNKNYFMIAGAAVALGLTGCGSTSDYNTRRTTTSQYDTYESATPRHESKAKHLTLQPAVSPDPGMVSPDVQAWNSTQTDVATDDSMMYRDTASNVQTSAYDRSQVVTFNNRSAVLTESEKSKIRNLVSTVNVGDIERVELAVWSDKSLPRAGTELTKADRDLADRRIASINRFLRDEMDISRMKISAYNMAEPANWLARTFRTDDAELKSAFALEYNQPMKREDFNQIYREGAASRAVLVIVPDND